MNTVVLWVATGQADGVLSLLHRDMLRPVVDRALDSVVPRHKGDAEELISMQLQRSKLRLFEISSSAAPYPLWPF